MSPNADIKRHLHALIDTLENRPLLQAVEDFLMQSPPVHLPALDEAIEQALQQSADGLGRPHATVMADMQAHFGEQA